MKKDLLYFSISILVLNLLFFAVGILGNIAFVGGFIGGLMAVGTDPVIVALGVLIGTALVVNQSKFSILFFIIASVVVGTVVHFWLGTTRLIVDVIRVDVLLTIPAIIIIVASFFTRKNKLKITDV